MKISVSMIALNEERFISRAISSCTFADEIVVVDGGSTDHTLAILQTHDKVRIIHHPWEGHFGRQRQISLQHCCGDWVIRLDADEAFSKVFAAQITELLDHAPADVAAYRVRQCNLVGNECFYSRSADMFESIPRIWRHRNQVRWQHSIHESLTGFCGKTQDWNVYVVHFGFLDKSRFLQKAQTYAQIPGSLVNRPEDLVFRDYDFQPVPECARVASHVPPFHMPANSARKPQIAVIRGPHLDMDEIRCYGSLREDFDISVYTTSPLPPEVGQTQIQVFKLPDDSRVVTAMAGLEYALFSAQVLFVGQIVWPYSYQAIRIKEKFGQKVIALQTDEVPFAHEDDEALKNLKRYNRPRVDVFIASTESAMHALLIEGVAREKIVVAPNRSTGQAAGKAWELGLFAALERLQNHAARTAKTKKAS